MKMESRAKNSTLQHMEWSIGIFDECHVAKTQTGLTTQALKVMNCCFQIRMTGTPQHHGIYDWVRQVRWLVNPSRKLSVKSGSNFRAHGPKAMRRAMLDCARVGRQFEKHMRIWEDMDDTDEV